MQAPRGAACTADTLSICQAVCWRWECRLQRAVRCCNGLLVEGGADLCRSTIWAADRSTLQGASQSLTCGDELQVEQEADFGEGTELVDLQPGGADVAVDTDNRRQYVDLYHKHLLVTSIQPQFDSFARGWRQVSC